MVDKLHYLCTLGGAYNGGYAGPEASYGVMQPQVYGDGYTMHPQVCILDSINLVNDIGTVIILDCLRL